MRSANLFLLGGDSEEMARRSAQSIEAVTQASTVMTQSLQDLSRELMTLAQEHIRRNLDALGTMSRCRSIPELIAFQSEFAAGQSPASRSRARAGWRKSPLASVTLRRAQWRGRLINSGPPDFCRLRANSSPPPALLAGPFIGCLIAVANPATSRLVD